MATVLELPAHTPPKAQEIIVRQRSMIDHLKAATEEATTRTMRTLETTGAGAIVGFLEGRYQMEEVNGVPLAATAGLLSHAAAFYMGGANAEHFHNAGDGAFAAQGYITGKDVGRQMRERADKASGKAPAMFPAP
jgi:hypothetical protein